MSFNHLKPNNTNKELNIVLPKVKLADESSMKSSLVSTI